MILFNEDKFFFNFKRNFFAKLKIKFFCGFANYCVKFRRIFLISLENRNASD